MDRHPGIWWLAAGIASVAGALGFMVGASASPVAGVAITATFGVVAASFGFLHQRELLTRSKAESGSEPSLILPEGSTGQLDRLPPYLGQMMVLFAVSLLVGTLVGSYTRFLIASRPAVARPFPWSASAAPSTAYDAIDWLVTAERLHALGYSDAQVEQLYKIGAAEKPGTSLLVPRVPISSLLGVPANQQGTTRKRYEDFLAYEPFESKPQS